MPLTPRSTVLATALLALVLALAAWWPVAAQEAPGDVDQLGPRQARFLARVKAGDANAAYDELLEGSSVKEQIETVAQLKLQTTRGIALYGGVMSTRIDPHAHRDGMLAYGSAIVACKKAPLFFYFVWYRPTADAPWRIQSVWFNDQVKEYRAWRK